MRPQLLLFVSLLLPLTPAGLPSTIEQAHRFMTSCALCDHLVEVLYDELQLESQQSQRSKRQTERTSSVRVAVRPADVVTRLSTAFAPVHSRLPLAAAIACTFGAYTSTATACVLTACADRLTWT